MPLTIDKRSVEKNFLSLSMLLLTSCVEISSEMTIVYLKNCYFSTASYVVARGVKIIIQSTSPSLKFFILVQQCRVSFQQNKNY